MIGGILIFKKYRSFILLLLTLVFFIQFIDRIIISVATQPMMKEFGLNATEWGLVMSAFFWGLVPFSIVAGIGSDKWGVKKVFAIGAIIWSIFTMGTALVSNFISLIIVRIFFGAGESPSASTAIKVVTNWFSPKEYSGTFGIAFSGVYLAPALISPVIVWMIHGFGWRVPFYAMGLLGIIWAVVWYKYFTDRPEQNPRMKEEEKQWLLNEQGEIATAQIKGQKKSLKELLLLPKGVKGTIFANLWSVFCIGYALYFLLTWLPGYLSIERGLSLTKVGYSLTVPWLGAALGEILGGKFSDLVYRKTGSKRLSRGYWIAAMFLILSVCLGVVVSVKSIISVIALLTIGAFAMSSASVISHTVVAETVPEQAGSQGGVTQLVKTIPGIIAPIITGTIVDVTGSFNNAFYLAAFIILSGVVITMFYLKPVKSNNYKIQQSTAQGELVVNNKS